MHELGNTPQPQSSAPANAPTGPKNAGKPGANYRGGGRGGHRGFHPYSRNWVNTVFSAKTKLVGVCRFLFLYCPFIRFDFLCILSIDWLGDSLNNNMSISLVTWFFLFLRALSLSLSLSFFFFFFLLLIHHQNRQTCMVWFLVLVFICFLLITGCVNMLGCLLALHNHCYFYYCKIFIWSLYLPYWYYYGAWLRQYTKHYIVDQHYQSQVWEP